MSDPEVTLTRYFVLVALAVLLVGRALISAARRARRDSVPLAVADVVEVVHDPRHEERARPAPRAAQRPTHHDLPPPADASARDLRAAIVTMEIFGPPRAFHP